MTEPSFCHAPVMPLYEVGDRIVVLAPDNTRHQLAGESAALAREVIAYTSYPRTRAQILDHIGQQAGVPITQLSVVDDLLALLRKTGILVPIGDRLQPRRQAVRPRVLLAICGAVSASLSPGLVHLLQRRGYEVRIVATPTALRFVCPEPLEALVHDAVRSQMFRVPETGRVHTQVPHIELAQWADAVLVCPASATTLARLAAGDHSTLVSSVVLTTGAPVMLVPSMNREMLTGAAVQRNLEQLRVDGFHIAHVGSGVELACRPDRRERRAGAMPPHDVVVKLLQAMLAGQTHRMAIPHNAETWDRLFRTREQLDWHCESLDPDIAERLAELATPGQHLLDIGTGLGTAAVAAARRGLRVVASDISKVALTRARERAPDANVLWLCDNICDTHLQSTFDILLDRGCLHLLSGQQIHAYTQNVGALCRPGGWLVLKTHAVTEGTSRQTTPYDSTAVERLLGHAFEIEADLPSQFPGPRDTPAARLFVLRRRA